MNELEVAEMDGLDRLLLNTEVLWRQFGMKGIVVLERWMFGGSKSDAVDSTG
jgi:hypothetical protein